MTQNKELFSTKECAPGKIILLVEDDFANASLLVEAIEQETPYKVVLAPDALAALEVASQIKPNLFLLDYRLPRVDGISLSDQLRALKGLEDVPTLIVTADMEIPQTELETRQIVSIGKPFDLDELLHTIEELVNPVPSVRD